MLKSNKIEWYKKKLHMAYVLELKTKLFNWNLYFI